MTSNLFRLEIKEKHSNAVVCVKCEIHGDPGKYDVTIGKTELHHHLRKHIERIAALNRISGWETPSDP